MPANVTKSKFLAKAAANPQAAQAIKKHRTDETKYGLEDLPPGIKAIARVTKCEFAELDKDTKQKTADGKSAAGQFRFQIQAVIVEPEYHNHNGIDVKIAGRQIWKFEPYFDTKTGAGKVVSLDDHVANILNEMRKLAGDEYTSGMESPADLEQGAIGITEAKPYFNFSTSVRKALKPGDPDGVWENWNGNRGLENYGGAGGGDDGVQDDSAGGTTTDATTDDATGGDADAVDLDAMISAAADGTDENSAALKEYAAQFGIEGDAIENAADWDEVKTMIETARDGGGDSGDATQDDAEMVPEKGGVYAYAPPDAKDKTGKKRLKPADCTCTAVDAKKKTTDLRNLSTKAIYKAVPWDQLTPA